MAQIIHNISTPNDGLGDELRTAMGNQNSMNTELYTNKVDKVTGKQLSTNDFTNAQVTKLAGIEDGAEVNVQADWSQNDDTQDDYIKNKPQQLFSSVGYFHYNDTATSTTPLSFVADTEVQLTNNQLGAQTNLDQAPYGVSTVFNSTTNKFDFSALSIGDAMTLRVDLKLTTTSSNQKYKVFLRVGEGGDEQYDLLIFSGQIKTISTDYQIVGEMGFSLDYQSHIDNPAVLYILSDDEGSVEVIGFYVFTIRKGVNLISGGAPSTPTLQEVTDVGNETTNEVIVRQNANNYVAIGNDGYTRWFTDVFGAYAEGKLGVIIGQNEVGTVIYEDDGLGNLIPSTSTYLDGLEVVSQDILNNKSVALKPNGFRKIESGNNYFSILPNQNNLLINGSVVISANVTAVNGVCFNIVATATITDPTPTEGMGYYVNVINGIATVGGVAYSVGTKLFRHYISGNWRTFVYPSTLQLENFLRDETLLKGYVCLTPSGISAPNSFRDVTYSSSTTTGYILQNNYGKTGAVGMVGFQSTAVAGTVAFKRRNDSYIFTNTNATIWQKIEFDSNVSGARFHHLLSNNFQFTSPTNVNQTSLLNCVGFCKLATSDNLHILHNDSSGTATVMDLGASFPANNSSGNKRYLLGIQIKATSYVLTVIEINTTTNALTTNIYTTEVSTDIPARSLSALQISTMITNNATASNATYLDGGLVATNLF